MRNEEFETAMDTNRSCRTCASYNAQYNRCDSIETTINRTWDTMTCRFWLNPDLIARIKKNSTKTASNG